MAVRGDGRQLVCATIKGALAFWDLDNMRESGERLARAFGGTEWWWWGHINK